MGDVDLCESLVEEACSCQSKETGHSEAPRQTAHGGLRSRIAEVGVTVAQLAS